MYHAWKNYTLSENLREVSWTRCNWFIPTNHKHCRHRTRAFGDLIQCVILLAMCTFLCTVSKVASQQPVIPAAFTVRLNGAFLCMLTVQAKKL